MTVAIDKPYRLNPKVALRPEPFGALAYNYDNRRLVFLRSPDMVRVVENLAETNSIAHAFEAANIGASRQPAFLSALEELVHAGVINAR